MLHLRGCPALSEFRLQKLLQQLQAHIPAVTGVSADYLHIAELEGALNGEEQQVLEDIALEDLFEAVEAALVEALRAGEV